MPDNSTLHTVAFLVVAAIVIVGLLTGWLRKAAARSRLANRQSFNDDEFRRTFYARDEARADTATRVRKVLASNLEMPLDAVRPEDRLDDDLNTQIQANPGLFAELEHEFGIATGYDDLDTFVETTERLITFADLVEYVHERVSQASATKADREQETSLSERIGLLVEDFVPIACVAGLVIAVVGAILRIDVAWRLGSGLFMLGIAAFVISIFIVGIETLTIEFREQGMTWVREHPIRATWVGFLVAAIVCLSLVLLLSIVRVFAGAA